jgi:hypothetical protein
VPVRTLRGESETKRAASERGGVGRSCAARTERRLPEQTGRDVPGGLVLRGAGLAGAVAEGG